ncbi:MAG: hypothetical protein J0M12_03005 [Deltaproteobacteria bacterium]|nr:hypothetical protein [Deltaproteobacteria bacterium]
MTEKSAILAGALIFLTTFLMGFRALFEESSAVRMRVTAAWFGSTTAALVLWLTAAPLVGWLIWAVLSVGSFGLAVWADYRTRYIPPEGSIRTYF